MFGAATTAAIFSSDISDGDTLSFLVTQTSTDTNGNILTSEVPYTFTFQTTISDPSTEFNSLDSLAAAIDSQTGLNGNIYNDRLVISSTDETDSIEINSGGTSDIKSVLGLDDIVSAGNQDTPIDGLVFVYSGNFDDTGVNAINLTVTQGIADRIYNLTELFIEDNGIIDQNVDSLTVRQDNLKRRY